MDSLAFRIRGETCDQVTKAVSILTLHKNERGGYAYNDARIFEKEVKRAFIQRRRGAAPEILWTTHLKGHRILWEPYALAESLRVIMDGAQRWGISVDEFQRCLDYTRAFSCEWHADEQFKAASLRVAFLISVVALAIAVYVTYKRSSSGAKLGKVEDEIARIEPVRLQINNGNEAKLGEGGFGAVRRAQLRESRHADWGDKSTFDVAVKSLREAEEVFRDEGEVVVVFLYETG